MSHRNSTKHAFSCKCHFCGLIWGNRDEFLEDPAIELVGYQANFKELQLGLFLFNHHPCHSTMAIYAEKFRDLYDGPVFEKPQTGKQDCPDLCLHKGELGQCWAQCECAYVREVCGIIRAWPKLTAV